MSTKKDKFSKKIKLYETCFKFSKSSTWSNRINPSVGCVIVKNDEIISIGQTINGDLMQNIMQLKIQ